MEEALGLVFVEVLAVVLEDHAHCRDQSNLVEDAPCPVVEVSPGIVLVIGRLWQLEGLEELVVLFLRHLKAGIPGVLVSRFLVDTVDVAPCMQPRTGVSNYCFHRFHL